MKLQRGVKHFIIFLLAFLMAFEPFAVNMVYAGGDPDSEETNATESIPEQEKETIDEDDGIEEVVDTSTMTPSEYLEYMYSLRGRSKEDLKEITITKDGRELDEDEKIKAIEGAFAWGEWMNTLSGAYAIMDDGCTDVFSFYSTLGNFVRETSNAPTYLWAIQIAANKAALAGTFIAKITGLKYINDKIRKLLPKKGNLVKGFKAIGKFYSKGLNNAVDFISHMQPPVGWKKGCATGEGTVAYWRWVARKTGLSQKQGYKNAIKKLNEHLSDANKIDNRGVVIKNSKGIAQTIGIGLTVIGIAMDTYDLVKSEDRMVGRWSYPVVKNVASLLLGVGALVAMFCVPVVGQFLAVVTLVWTCLTLIADQFGKYNKKWKDAYKNSYWFLYQSDPEFRSYYDNRDDLTYDEKSACYVIFERNYKEDYKENARAFERDHKGENSYYDDKTQDAISARVYIEMEKQGVVTSYYNRAVFKEPNIGNSDLYDLWKTKASYMAWKPTEEESVRASNRGFWGKLGHTINPMTYISWAGDKLNSVKYNKEVARNNYPKVWFNPDFTLMKRYQRWLTSNKKIVSKDVQPNNNDFYRAIGLRIEQSPYNYLPLVDYDVQLWSDDLLLQAFNADAFFVGVKEMMYFRNMIAPMTKEVKNFTKDVTKKMNTTRDALKESLDRLTNLRALCDLCQSNSNRDNKDAQDWDNNNPFSDALYERLKKDDAFNWGSWDKDSMGEKTPKNVLKYYWKDINVALTLDVRSVSLLGAECKLLMDTIKKNLDMATLMEDLYQEKRDALDNFDSDFTNKSFNKYLRENKFLNVNGGGVLDWLSDIYPAYKEMDKYSELYKKEIDKFAKAANESNQGHKKVLFFFTKKDDKSHPNNVLKDINNYLKDQKETIKKFEELLTDPDYNDLTLSISSDDTGIFPEEGYRTLGEGEDIQALDPEEEVSDSEAVTAVPQDVTEASIIPEGDE